MITGKTELLSVIGNPIKHSLSPLIHNYISQKLGLDYIYNAFNVTDLEGAIAAMRTLDIRGYNVTAPYKYHVMKYIDILSDNAKYAGSVNTVVNKNGVLTGYSTDGEGLLLGMNRKGIEINDLDILVLGAGGVTRPICVMLKGQRPKSVVISNRTIEKAKDLCELLNNDGNLFTTECKNHYDLIINTTSVGMGTDDCPIKDFSIFENAKYAVDLIYYPKKTKFLEMAEKYKLKTANGIGMLIGQAIKSYEYFTGVKLDYSIYDELEKLIDE